MIIKLTSKTKTIPRVLCLPKSGHQCIYSTYESSLPSTRHLRWPSHDSLRNERVIVWFFLSLCCELRERERERKGTRVFLVICKIGVGPDQPCGRCVNKTCRCVKKKLKYFKFAAFTVGMRLGSEDLSFCYFLTVVCVR